LNENCNLQFSQQFRRFCTQRCHRAREELDAWQSACRHWPNDTIEGKLAAIVDLKLNRGAGRLQASMLHQHNHLNLIKKPGKPGFLKS
jgi:GH24 family phage-related lysozyme (muramidase)